MIDFENMIDILIVDDDKDDAEMIIRALKKLKLGSYFLHVQDGEEALKLLYSDRSGNFPKLILLDLKMPKVDGLDVIKKLKSDEIRKVIPIVVLTSSNETADIIKSYELGVNAYIIKPMNFESFTKAIQEIGLFWTVLNQLPH
jgi:two-component system, response regulator